MYTTLITIDDNVSTDVGGVVSFSSVSQVRCTTFESFKTIGLKQGVGLLYIGK